MLTPDQSHDLCGSLTVIAARTALEQRRLRRGDVDGARTTAVLAEIAAVAQNLAQQIEALNRESSEGGVRGEVRADKDPCRAENEAIGPIEPTR